MPIPPELDSCPLCGGAMTRFHGASEVVIGSRRAMVADEHDRCTECGEGFYAPGQLEALQLSAAEQLRIDDGLLTPKEIKSIRERLGMTQTAFERLLGVGAKTVVRWERGTVSQNKATDNLIRAVANVPGVATFLDKQGRAVGRGSPR